MAQPQYRLVTRSDFDGLVCAVLLREIGLINEILFVHPKDMQDGKIEITGLGPDRRVRTRFFTTDQTDDAAEFGALINREPGCNVYVGAALRTLVRSAAASHSVASSIQATRLHLGP
jgi:hypothetical protein